MDTDRLERTGERICRFVKTTRFVGTGNYLKRNDKKQIEYEEGKDLRLLLLRAAYNSNPYPAHGGCFQLGMQAA